MLVSIGTMIMRAAFFVIMMMAVMFIIRMMIVVYASLRLFGTHLLRICLIQILYAKSKIYLYYFIIY
jgi:hypothetical protein